jgi:hypothetical protein
LNIVNFDPVITLRLVKSTLSKEVHAELPHISKGAFFKVLTTMYVEPKR